MKNSQTVVILLLVGILLGIGIIAGVIIQRDSGGQYQETAQQEPSSLNDQNTRLNSELRDEERDDELLAIFAQLEAYHAENGFYPTSKQLQDTSWMKRYFPTLTGELLSDPDGERINSSDSDYKYEPEECRDSQCQHYTLTAQLESGQVLKKVDLNQ